MEQRIAALESDAGRYTIIATKEGTFKTDTRTGETWSYVSHNMTLPTQDGTLVTQEVSGWWPAISFSQAMERAAKTALGFTTTPKLDSPK